MTDKPLEQRLEETFQRLKEQEAAEAAKGTEQSTVGAPYETKASNPMGHSWFRKLGIGITVLGLATLCYVGMLKPTQSTLTSNVSTPALVQKLPDGVTALNSAFYQIDSVITLPLGKHFVDKDICVASTGKLTLLPGSELYFGKDAGISCKGNLEAIGDQQRPILFTSLGDSWKNIVLTSNQPSKLSYCIFRQGHGRDHDAYLDRQPMAFSGQMRGGAILIANSKAGIDHCTFENNQAYEGGAIFLDDANATISYCNFFDNSGSTRGGGIATMNSKISINQNVFSRNNSSFGGGAWFFRSEIMLIENLFEANNADEGGGLKCEATGGGIWDNTFRSNRATQRGAGLDLRGNSPEGHSFLMEGNKILSNVCTGEYSRGGGVHAEYLVMPLMSWNHVEGNKAECGAGFSFMDSSDIYLSQNTMENNTASNTGGGIWMQRVKKMYMQKNLIGYNTAGNGVGGIFFADMNLSGLYTYVCKTTATTVDYDSKTSVGINLVDLDKNTIITEWKKMNHNVVIGNTPPP
ncbi:right-handed parallel beta-helix repeat-containing protein [Candidatus Woesearchaeota archaeon]|nr:right-handed parallel beta-helix repeat-containing protein [Candidatus Woesearchaeota archaeon]